MVAEAVTVSVADEAMVLVASVVVVDPDVIVVVSVMVLLAVRNNFLLCSSKMS